METKKEKRRKNIRYYVKGDEDILFEMEKSVPDTQCLVENQVISVYVVGFFEIIGKL